MTDFGRRRDLPSQACMEDCFEDIDVSRMAIFFAALRILVERARLMTRAKQFPETARQLIETVRRTLFSDRTNAKVDYDVPESEISPVSWILPPDILGPRRLQRLEQYPDAHRLVLHAAGL